jgi:hypothetical protein
LFETTRDSLEEYVLFQRPFGFPDRGKCYLETGDREFCGHFPIRSAIPSRNQLQITFGDDPSKMIVVLLTATDSVYDEVKPVLEIMIPEIALR